MQLVDGYSLYVMFECFENEGVKICLNLVSEVAKLPENE